MLVNDLPLYLCCDINVLLHYRRWGIKDELLQDRQLWAVFQVVLKILQTL